MSQTTKVWLIVAGLCLAFSIFFVRWIGDQVIRLAGADHKELRRWSVDRGYFLGLGLALFLSSGISTVALLIATSVAFGIRVVSVPALACGAVYFFLIFSLDRWLVSDQTAGFAPNKNRAVSVAVAWVRNFIAEALKVAPRVLIVYFASALFADFILLVVFSAEIKQQMNVMEVQAETQYTSQMQAEIDKRTAKDRALLVDANKEKDAVQQAFNQGSTAIQAAAQERDAALAAKDKAGVRCYNQAVYATRRDPVTGKTTTVRVGTKRVCPPEIQQIWDAYNAQVAHYPQSQADVNRLESDIDQKYDVADLTKYVSQGAADEVHKEWADRKPQLADGLLVRMRALDLLTTKPTGVCDASKPDSSFSDACISRYSARAAALQRNLRFWILFLEMTPVVLKFVTSILPRRGYASVMAARDEEAKAAADIHRGKVQARVRAEVERTWREERLRMELETAGQEIELRELERQKQLENIRRIRSRLPGIEPESLETVPRVVPAQSASTRWAVRLKMLVSSLMTSAAAALPWRRREQHYVDMMPTATVSYPQQRRPIDGEFREEKSPKSLPGREPKQGRRVVDSEDDL